MIALRVEDDYLGFVSLVVMRHERAALVTVEADAGNGLEDVYLGVEALHDLARIAILAADMLDGVTS